MSKALLEKLLRAREKRVEVDGRTYTIRRPTDADVMQMRDRPPLEFVTRFVIGWTLQEIDLVPGGMAIDVPFDPALWAAWVMDHPEVWDPLSMAIVSAYEEHVKERETAAKN